MSEREETNLLIKRIVFLRELRFVLGDEFIEAWVRCEMTGGTDDRVSIDGWHHKTFPSTVPVSEIVDAITSSDDPVLWPLDAPR